VEQVLFQALSILPITQPQWPSTEEKSKELTQPVAGYWLTFYIPFDTK